MHGYLPYEKECINDVILGHTKPLIKVFEARKLAEVKAMMMDKRIRRTFKAKLPILINRNNVNIQDAYTPTP